MRVDAKKNTTKVASEIIKDPLQTARELAERTGMGASTANRARKELAQNGTIKKDDGIIEICKKDKRIVEKTQNLSLAYLDSFEVKNDDTGKIELVAPDKTEMPVVIKAGEVSQKRMSMLGSEITDENGAYTKEHREMVEKAISDLVDVV